MNNKITLVGRSSPYRARPSKLFITMRQKTKCRGRDNHKNNTLTISSISRHKIYEKTRQMRQRSERQNNNSPYILYKQGNNYIIFLIKNKPKGNCESYHHYNKIRKDHDPDF